MIDLKFMMHGTDQSSLPANTGIIQVNLNGWTDTVGQVFWDYDMDLGLSQPSEPLDLASAPFVTMPIDLINDGNNHIIAFFADSGDWYCALSYLYDGTSVYGIDFQYEIVTPPDPAPDPVPVGQVSTRVYIRHRDRMVQESVQEDLVNTLIAFRWIPGTTTRPVISPYAPSAGRQIVTTTEEQVLAIVGQNPIQLIDYFPEATSDEAGLAGEPETGQTPLNTIAMDEGQPGEPIPIELGSTLVEIPYRFTFAFWAATNGIAQALLNDLRDRYRGLMVASDVVALYDYNVDPQTPVLFMDVNSFAYLRDTENEAAAHEATMYYAQLEVVDTVD